MACRWLRDSWKQHGWDAGYRCGFWTAPLEQHLPTQLPVRPLDGQVVIVRTCKTTGERLDCVPPLELSKGLQEESDGIATVTLKISERFQTFIGFGGSFTESSACLPMTESQKKEVMQAYFSKEKGLGYRLGRIHMNSCDFSKGNWSCCDKPDDMQLTSFSISRYEDAIIPMVKSAMESAGEQLLLLASPWSPPAWMKSNGKMCDGGKLRPECRQSWADHYVRFAQEFQRQGLPLWAFTVQNEPKAWMRWESCIYEHDEERDFVRDYLGPALQDSNLGLKVIVWDHNRDEIYDRAKACFEDKDAAAHIWGISFHWYGDPSYEFWPPWTHAKFEADCLNVQRVHDAWPSKHILFTEGCQEKGARIGDWALGERYAMEIIGQLNMWTEAWVDWNLILDETGGPNHVGNLCSAPVIFDIRRGAIIYQSSFYYIGHFSRYIQPGAQRIGYSTSNANLEVVAFANPDDTLVAIVLNRSQCKLRFQLQHGDLKSNAEALANSITTFMLLA